MKKSMRVLMCLVTFAVLIMGSSPSNNITIKAMENLISVKELDIEFCENQSAGIEEYQRLLTSFNEENDMRGVCEQIYDENYGGAYIDEEGNLVVQLVDSSNEEVEELKENTGNSNIKIENCEYAYNELIYVITEINDNLDYLLENEVIISEMYEDVYNNCVIICIKDFTDDKEKIIRKIIDSPCMEFKEESIRTEEEIEVKGGDKITNSEGISTVGFCADRNGVEGFVIAGHAGKTLYQEICISSVVIGSVSKTAYYNKTTADAAFVTKSRNASTTPKIGTYKCHYLGTDISDFPVGALVHKYGEKTGLTSGYILSNYYTSHNSDEDSNGYYFLNQTTASYTSDGGDSGGPVFIVKDVVNGNITCKLLGIHRGRVGENAIFSKYYNIVQELGITAITY